MNNPINCEGGRISRSEGGLLSSLVVPKRTAIVQRERPFSPSPCAIEVAANRFSRRCPCCLEDMLSLVKRVSYFIPFLFPPKPLVV